MPVALAYGPAGGASALVRCVYLGRDYSGRYGNFLGHALVLDDGDLVGLRPVEFWEAPLWSAAPAPPGSDLPELHELVPGTSTDPEALGGWLAEGGPDAYRRLGVLLDAVREALARGHGRLVLVSRDPGNVEDVVRWIAVLSFSLPWEAAVRLSFVTYSADPAAATQIVTGTTPDVWIPSDIDARVVRLAEPPGPAATGRFAATVAGLWRDMDLDGIDELGEFGAADPETAAALLALCRGDATVTEEEQADAARLLAGGGVPEWV
ncbi:GAP1-M domain-containing protein, partial [Planomonospora algeriensis]